MHPHSEIDYDKTPFVLIWEVTQACALACSHCRAEAIDQRDASELTLEEGRQLVDQVADMGTPIIVFTGGDPLQRDDLEALISHAKQRNMRAATIPAATPRLTLARVEQLKQAGLDQMALSLDGSTHQRHDTFRGVEGSFEKTMAGAEYARQCDLALQINTCFGSWNFDDFDAIAELIERLGIVFWEVFFLVPTGRGKLLESLTAEGYEQVFAKLHALQQRVSFIIKVTRQRSSDSPAHTDKLLARPIGPRGSVGMAPKGVNAGKGFCFISHDGEVFPSGFLPISGGNVRRQPLADIYRESPIFRTLRDPEKLTGRCGRCEYRDLCGGSRSRAYALSGDYLAEDPCCLYEPAEVATPTF
jgi:radical SAM protein